MSKFEVVCTSCGSVNVTLVPREYIDHSMHVHAECNDCKSRDKLSLNQPSGAFVMPFGKYRGKSIEWIVDNDRGYGEWVLRSELKENIKLRFADAMAPKGQQSLGEL